MKRSKPVKDLLRSAINEAAITSVKLPPLDLSGMSDKQEYILKSRIMDFKLLRDMGHFDQDKRAEFEDMLRDAAQPEDIVQAFASHYTLIAREKAKADEARHTISHGLSDAGKQISKRFGHIRSSIEAFTKKLDL